jgi:predicted acyltransferase
VIDTPSRLASLDAFRGFTIAAMLLVNNPGDWSHAYAPLLHAPWHGWTFTDTIFPFFLFIVGVSMVTSTHRQIEHGVTRSGVLRKLWLRCTLIVLIGVAMNLVPHFDFVTVRIPGVLQRIGLASALVAPFVVLWPWRVWMWAMLGSFALYSVLMFAVPVPDANEVVAAGVLEPGKDFGAYVDRAVFGGHLWRVSKTWDPEGLVSTLPALGNVLAGALLGLYLRRKLHAPSTQCVWIALIGFALVCLGGVLAHTLMPINKNLWTVSYSVLMSGWALLAFGTFYWLMDACESVEVRANAQSWFTPFTVFGMNALFIFVLAGLVGRLLVFTKLQGVSTKSVLYAPLKSLPLEPRATSLLFALAFTVVMFLIAWIMWKKRWFVKI